jgi:hypothetical protein
VHIRDVYDEVGKVRSLAGTALWHSSPAFRLVGELWAAAGSPNSSSVPSTQPRVHCLAAH